MRYNREYTQEQFQELANTFKPAFYTDQHKLIPRIESGEVAERLMYIAPENRTLIERLELNSTRIQINNSINNHKVDTGELPGVLHEGRYYPQESDIGKPIDEILAPYSAAHNEQLGKVNRRVKIASAIAIGANLPGAIVGVPVGIAAGILDSFRPGPSSGSIGLAAMVATFGSVAVTALGAPYFFGATGLAYSALSLGSFALYHGAHRGGNMDQENYSIVRELEGAQSTQNEVIKNIQSVLGMGSYEIS